jgi:hypothetical protein
MFQLWNNKKVCFCLCSVRFGVIFCAPGWGEFDFASAVGSFDVPRVGAKHLDSGLVDPWHAFQRCFPMEVGFCVCGGVPLCVYVCFQACVFMVPDPVQSGVMGFRLPPG